MDSFILTRARLWSDLRGGGGAFRRNVSQEKYLFRTLDITFFGKHICGVSPMLLTQRASLEVEGLMANPVLVPGTSPQRDILESSFLPGGLPRVGFWGTTTYLVFPQVR